MHLFSFVFSKLGNKVRYFWGVYIRRDSFYLAHRQWRKDEGEVYLRLNYQLNPDSVVFDVGGYRGDFADNIINKFGCKVHLFEPSKESYEFSSIRFAGMNNIICHNFGLGSYTRQEVMLLDENRSRVAKEIISEIDKVTQIEILDILEVLSSLNLDYVDLLKINTEGSEFEILERLLLTGTISKFGYLQIQFHNFFEDAQERVHEIRERLKKTHELEWSYDFVWESWRPKA